MMVVNVTGAVHEVVEGLKHHPFVMTIVLINLMCIGIVAYTLYNVTLRSTERDKMLTSIMEICKIK